MEFTILNVYAHIINKLESLIFRNGMCKCTTIVCRSNIFCSYWNNLITNQLPVIIQTYAEEIGFRSCIQTSVGFESSVFDFRFVFFIEGNCNIMVNSVIFLMIESCSHDVCIAALFNFRMRRKQILGKVTALRAANCILIVKYCTLNIVLN